MNFKLSCTITLMFFSSISFAQEAIYQAKTFSIFPDHVTQGDFTAKAISPVELTSNYISPEAGHYSPDISFKFSINSRDNEMAAGKNHEVTLQPVNGMCTTNVVFGKQTLETTNTPGNSNLHENTRWTVKLDMRAVMNAFKTQGFYTLYNGDKLYKQDFKGVYIAGNSAPLMWDFNNLYTRQEFELKDPDGDGIFETTLIMNKVDDIKKTDASWKLDKSTALFPQYQSPYPLSTAIYNMSTEEMIKAVEPDSTFRTGKEWAGVWTRDISYSIILSMAYLQPQVAKYSLLRKVKNNHIIQDTGTGGAYPVSTDRMIWATAAWELYKATGDLDWLKQAYIIVKNSIEADMTNAYDSETGLVRGESSFLDWREQTYPRWMQPADIYESECLGTNAVHYQANIVLSEMADLLNDKTTAEKHRQIAQNIKNGINQYLWLSDKGYYGQYIYGRDFKTVSPRSEALGEALCVLFGITDEKQAESIISKVPLTDYGISCIYPQIPGIPPYHNNAVWPFVQAYWALASAKTGNQASVIRSFADIYRPAALFLTNKENFVADNGDFAGTQINSSNMLWSLSGNLALIHKILFGIHFQSNGLKFQPFVPKALQGEHVLNNFKYRAARLNITIHGYGDAIATFTLDGKAATALLPTDLTGEHSIDIQLNNYFEKENSNINEVANYTTIETPQAKYEKGKLSWQSIEGATSYKILKNGKTLLDQIKTELKIKSGKYAEYQVLAIDKNGISSFASEPVPVFHSANIKTIEIENIVKTDSKNYVETDNGINTEIKIPVEINKNGKYFIYFRYANGSGPVNTENKCAIRSLLVDNQPEGVFVFPQRGKDEWSNWGNSNSISVQLKAGQHEIKLVLTSENGNMNGEINKALIDKMFLIKAD